MKKKYLPLFGALLISFLSGYFLISKDYKVTTFILLVECCLLWLYVILENK
jgi:hypothetical protein